MSWNHAWQEQLEQNQRMAGAVEHGDLVQVRFVLERGAITGATEGAASMVKELLRAVRSKRGVAMVTCSHGQGKENG